MLPPLCARGPAGLCAFGCPGLGLWRVTGMQERDRDKDRDRDRGDKDRKGDRKERDGDRKERDGDRKEKDRKRHANRRALYYYSVVLLYIVSVTAEKSDVVARACLAFALLQPKLQQQLQNDAR